MAMKYITLISVLVVVLAAAQAEALVLPLPSIPLYDIIGNVSCSVNGTIGVNGTNLTVPPFRNALVQLSCGGLVRGIAVTNQMGMFNIFLSGLLTPLNTILSSCRLVVVTPLSICNATLPSTGTLQAPLQFLNNTIFGILNITYISAGAFVRV